MIKFNPLTLKKIRKFKSIKRGYYSLIIFSFFVLLSLFAELLINSRAFIVNYNGDYYFPTYGGIIPGMTFGLDYEYETNYRELKKQFEGTNNWLIMPPFPYNPFENDYREGTYPPYPPSTASQHYLGTDKSGRDVLARLFYGFRVAIIFSFTLLFLNYFIGIIMGCLIGYIGGRFDLCSKELLKFGQISLHFMLLSLWHPLFLLHYLF